MRTMLAPLSLHEETALREVGFGSSGPLAPEHIPRLLRLELIEWTGWRWALTEIGQRRYGVVVSNEDPEDG